MSPFRGLSLLGIVKMCESVSGLSLSALLRCVNLCLGLLLSWTSPTLRTLRQRLAPGASDDGEGGEPIGTETMEVQVPDR